MNWHRMTSAELFGLLGSSRQGLNTAIAGERLVLIGANELKESKKKSIGMLMFSQFKDTMIVMLLMAAIASGIIGDFSDAIVILVIVFLNATMGFLQEYRAEKAMKVLKKLSATQAKVLRDGIQIWLPATALVPGDIVLMRAVFCSELAKRRKRG